MYLGLEKANTSKAALIDDDGHALSYGELIAWIKTTEKKITPRSVVFALATNSAPFVTGLLSVLNHDAIPLILPLHLDRELLKKLDREYEPAYYFVPDTSTLTKDYKEIAKFSNYSLLRTDNPIYPVHPELEMLLSTSGSLGSPKLVRYKKGNMEWNARNVSKEFNWTDEERQICSLPLNYVMGLNSMFSTLVSGGTVLLTNRNIMDQQFWDFVRDEKGTNFTGVPFSYELLLRLHIEKMDLPELVTFALGGGKLKEKSFVKFVKIAEENAKKFYSTYGTTETSARCSILRPDRTIDKPSSIGKPMNEVCMHLLDPNQAMIIEPFQHGELVITGKHVSLGYATSKQDLGKPDEFNGSYQTGDIAYFDDEGFFFIVGRKKRFIKILGNRIGLDECEHIIHEKFNIHVACIGVEDQLMVLIDEDFDAHAIKTFLSHTIKMQPSLLKIVRVENFPRNDSGKILYRDLEKNFLPAAK